MTMGGVEECLLNKRKFYPVLTGSFFLQGMQGNMNQMVPPMPQGHFMGMNAMPSGSGLPGNIPPGGIPNGLLNMQGPSNASGSQMFQPGGGFNRPQTGQMQMMPGLNPYQVRSIYSYIKLYFPMLFIDCPPWLLKIICHSTLIW